MSLPENLRTQLRAIYMYSRPQPDLARVAYIFGITEDEARDIIRGDTPDEEVASED